MLIENRFLRFDMDTDALAAEIVFKETDDRYVLDLRRTAGVQVGRPRPSAPMEIGSCGELVASRLERGEIILRFVKEGISYEGGFALGDDSPDLIAFIRPLDFKETAVVRAAFPGAIEPLQEGKLKYLIPIQQGLMMEEGAPQELNRKGVVEKDGEALVAQMRHAASGEFTAVPLTLQSYFWGVLGERASIMAVLETFWDVGVQFDGGRLSRPIWKPSLGHLRYERRVRYRFSRGNSYVDMTKEYRRHVERQGWIKTLKEKAEERPLLRQAFGGCYMSFGYCEDPQADYIGALRRLKQRGLNKAFCSSLYTYYPGGHGGGLIKETPNLDLRHQADKVRSLGYLFGAFANLGLIATGNPDYEPRSLLKGFDGGPVMGWKCGGYDFHEKCRSVLAYGDIKNEELFDNIDLIDLDQSIGWTRECFDPLHPHDKRMAMECLKVIFKRLARGHVLMGEEFEAWKTPWFDIMRTKGLPFIGASVPWTGLPNKCWSVPLAELIFHDCVMYTWWEGDAYDFPFLHPEVGGNPDTQSTADALYGEPPMLSPVGCQLYFKNQEDMRNSNYSLARMRLDNPLTQKSLDLAIKVCQVTEKVATDKMLSHKFLDADGHVQQTEFESGVSVVANFGADITTAAGVSIPPTSWKVVAGM